MFLHPSDIYSFHFAHEATCKAQKTSLYFLYFQNGNITFTDHHVAPKWVKVTRYKKWGSIRKQLSGPNWDLLMNMKYMLFSESYPGLILSNFDSLYSLNILYALCTQHVVNLSTSNLKLCVPNLKVMQSHYKKFGRQQIQSTWNTITYHYLPFFFLE